MHMCFTQDIDDADIEAALETLPRTPLHIVLFCDEKEEQLEGIYMVGDGIKFTIKVNGGVTAALLKLLCAYYIFDVEYPRQYSMFLSIMQVLVMEEPYKKPMSQKCRLFIKKIRAAFLEVDLPVVDLRNKALSQGESDIVSDKTS